MGNEDSGDWVKALKTEDVVVALRGLLTPWPEALRALGGLQSKRVGARTGSLDQWAQTLTMIGVTDGEGRLTTLGAMLALDEAERMFRDAFEL